MSQSRLSIIPSAAVADQSLTSTQLRVLCAIGSFTGKDRSAYPKQSTIADVIGVSRETVCRAISALSDKGYIEVHPQFRTDGGQMASLYFVRLDPCDAEITPPVTEREHGDPSVTPPVTSMDHTPCDAYDHTLKTIHKNDTSTADAVAVGAQDALPMQTPEQPKRKAPPRGAARGSRIADNWAPTPKGYAFAASQELTNEEINREADRFRNYWLGIPGRKGVKLDWEATWRNWLTGEYGIVTKKRQRAAEASTRTQSAGQSRGGGFVAAGLRHIGEARGYGEPVSEGGGMGAGYVIDREAS